MSGLLAITLLGFVLGMRHATDADHVIAVTTIVSRQRSLGSAALIGAFWGLGHTLTIAAVGSAIIVFNVVIPPRLGLAMELAVGLMLVLLGVLNLTGITRRLAERFTPQVAGGHAHPHAHGDFVHTHVHGHAPGHHGHAEDATPLARLDRGFARLGRGFGLYQALRPLAVGIVHGLAGSAAVALLVLAAIRNAAWGVAYLLVFGAGTIAGMTIITAAIAVPYAYTGRRFTRLNGALAAASGLLSLGFGLFIAYRIGFVDGLFTGHPHWTPR
ncbi:MAG TPA: sulfite exporter TauE/SafE family protein [Terriglobia bacterium]|nr:sulfite exporter TauE/SafE family protein [Terriglobia bacterium]